MVESRRMFVKDVAAFRGCSVSTARAWLAALEAQKSAVVRRLGRALYTTEEALRSLEPSPAAPVAEDLLEGIERQWRQTAREMAALRVAVRALGERVEELEAARRRSVQAANAREDSTRRIS